MKNVRLATTLLHSLRPVGTGAERDHGLLAETLRRELGPEAGDFLAEPVPAKDGSKIDWYVTSRGRPEALETLGPAEREALLAAYEARRAAILGLAARMEAGSRADRDTARALRHALEMPRSDALHRVDGRPVVAGWGYVEADRPLYDSALKAASPVRTPRPGPPPLSVPAPPPVAPAGVAPALAGRSFPFAPLLLWLLFALLLLAILWLLFGLFPGLRSGFAPAAPGVATAAELDRLAGLREDVSGLERRMSEGLAACTARPETDAAVEERITGSGAQGGALQISLIWDGAADLDLSALCPDGSRIGYEHPAGCGGRLDVDANGREVVEAPVENIVWPAGGTPPAEIPVEVTYFSAKGDPRADVPYRLRIRRAAPGGGPAEDRFVEGVARSAEARRPQRVETLASPPPSAEVSR